MMLVSKAQQTGLTISSYLNNLFYIIRNAYWEMLWYKAYINTLKKHLSGILDYIELKHFYPPML